MVNSEHGVKQSEVQTQKNAKYKNVVKDRHPSSHSKISWDNGTIAGSVVFVYNGRGER